jgi:hypothetical protein
MSGESGAAEGGSNIGGDGEPHFNGNKRALVVVDIEVSGIIKIIKKFFKVSRMLRTNTDNDKDVISVLKDMA